MIKEKHRPFIRRLSLLAAAAAICFTLTGQPAYASSPEPSSAVSTSGPESGSSVTGQSVKPVEEGTKSEEGKTTITPVAIAIAALMAGGAWLLRRTKGDYRDQR